MELIQMVEENEDTVKTKKVPAMLAMAAACAFASGQPRSLSWEEWPPLAEGVAGGAIAHVGDSIVYAGGTTWRNGEKHYLRDVLRYSPKSKKWTAGPSLPEPLAYGAYVQGDSFLEIYGGTGEKSISQNCWRLEQGAREWKQCGVLPKSSLFAGAAVVSKDVLLFGGCRDAVGLSTCTSSVMRRNAQGKWAQVTDLPGGAVALSAVAALDGHVYLFGGCIANSAGGVDNQASAYGYDPAKNSWKKLNPLPGAVRSASAIPLDGRRILIVGGYGDHATPQDAGSAFSHDVWIYDVASDAYEQAPAFPFGISGIGLARYDSGIVGVGGEDRIRGRSLRVVHGHFKE
jgi:N-acetylneuraminic acid mutarotase